MVDFLSLSRLFKFHFGSQAKALKADLRVWNEEVFGNVYRQKRLLLENLQGLDVIEEERALRDEEKVRKTKAISDSKRSHTHGGGEFEAKSRTLKLIEDDKCMKFFHRMSNSNRRNNSIESLIVDGTISTDYIEINEYIVQSYNNLYTEQGAVQFAA
jgi:hypothetical protein